MPRQHPSILESLPSDRLRIGEYAIDASTREIRREGDEAQRVSLKAMDVLLLLARNPGKVVARQTILDGIWPDTLPTDEVVTQAVAQLRKALGDGKPARYIETISKHGYRLLAPVEWMPREATPRADEPFGARVRLAHGGRMAVFVAAVIAAASAAGWWWSRPKPAPAAASAATTARPAVVRLTSLPGSESWPALSPDGALMAYSREQPEGSALMLQTTAPVAPRALTDGKGEHDLLPAWSRDGRQIAFVRYGADKRCKYMAIAASGGTPREVGGCLQPNRFDWAPDGTALLAGGSASASHALHTIGLRDGREHPFPYEHPADAQDLAPTYSPDGKWIAFQRGISRADLWRVPAAGGRPQRITRLETNFYGFAWAPDGKSLVASRYADHGLRLSRIDVGSGALTDLDVDDASYPSIALHAPALAFVADTATVGIYRTTIPPPRAQADADNVPTRVFASSGSELLPSVSPDGKRIAFYSDRSGSSALWWAELGDASPPQLVEGITPVLRQAPVWSGDGNRLLVVDSAPQGDRLLDVDLASGRGVALQGIAGTPLRMAWLPGDNAVVVVVDRGGGNLVATRYDRAGDRWITRGRLEHADAVRMAPDGGHVLFTRDNAWGLWQADLDLSAARPIDDFRSRPGSDDLILPAAGFFIQPRRLVAWSGGSAILGADSECAIRWIVIPRAKAPVPRMAPCIETRPGQVLGASYDAIHRQLYYGYSSDENDDIGWMRLPEAAPNPRR